MRILIIEDEQKLAAAVKRALELQRYAVEVSHDGSEGFDLACAENYDLILLDGMLPSMDGVEVCRQLRAHKVETPILMLTARGQVSDKTKGLDSGADDYLVKPFSFEELFSRIRALLRRAQVSRDPVLSIADLELDPAQCTVKRSHKNIALSTKEFSILEYLLRNKGTVVSKDQIVQHVWSYNSDILPTTVEVHIKNLRDKIEKPFGGELIQTVRGFGYTINEEKKRV